MYENLRINTFQRSGDLYLDLIKSDLSVMERRSGGIQAAPQVIEVIEAVGNMAILPSLAIILGAWLKRNQNRKLIITNKDGSSIHLEGMSDKEIEKYLVSAVRVDAVDTGKNTQPVAGGNAAR